MAKFRNVGCVVAQRNAPMYHQQLIRNSHAAATAIAAPPPISNRNFCFDCTERWRDGKLLGDRLGIEVVAESVLFTSEALRVDAAVSGCAVEPEL